MRQSTSPLILLPILLAMGCASTKDLTNQRSNEAELRVFYENGTQYYKCLFYPDLDHITCDIAPSEPNQPRCL